MVSGGIPRQVVAVDWSGSLSSGRSNTWLARASVPSAELVEFDNGRDASQICDRLLEIIAEEPHTVVGLDFAFSLPAWYMEEKGFTSAGDLWAADGMRETWLRDCPAPFWGRGPNLRKPQMRGDELRATERAVIAAHGMVPKSVFQLVGPGQVGPSSLRGMGVLRRLRAEGSAAIWPFDAPRLPLVVEIYPRLFIGDVVVSRPAARQDLMRTLGWPVDARQQRAMFDDDNAFDAGMSALGLVRSAHQLASLRVASAQEGVLEGQIFAPDHPLGAQHYPR